jgi:hypothetical protein
LKRFQPIAIGRSTKAADAVLQRRIRCDDARHFNSQEDQDS